MADYDLGTAHGRIVVDYNDKGMEAVEKDLDNLQKKAKSLLGRFGAMAKDWRSHGQNMSNTAKNVAKSVGLITGVAVAAHVAMNGFGASFGILREARSLVGDLGTALGAIPSGMENFPTAVQRVVRLNAAVSVLTGTLGLLARSTSNLRGISVVTGLLGTFGGRIKTLAGPLRLVSALAFGFVTVLKGFAPTKQIIKYFGALHAALGLVGGSIHLISGLADSIRDLSKSALLLPAVIGAGALAMGTFKIATQGVGDALKAMEDPAKFAEALKKLSPAAREAVTEVQKLVKPFKEIQQAVQEKFFKGLGPIIAELGGTYLPILQGGLEKVAGSFNRTIKEVAAFFQQFEGSDEVANDFAQGLGFSAKAIDNLLKAVRPLTEAFYMLWRVGSEVFAEITGGAGAAAQKFADFIKEARSSGDLARWMREGWQALKDLGAVALNVGRILSTIFKGISTGDGQTFLGFLRSATDRMLAFLKSAEGQDALKTLGTVLQHSYESAVKLASAFMTYVYPAIKAMLPFILRMSEAVGDGLVGAMVVLGPVFQALGKVLEYLAPILGPIVTAMVFLTTTAIGLGIAAAILSKALLILRIGFLAAKAGAAVFRGIVGLLTGNLGPIGRAVLSLARFIGTNLLGALRTVGPWLKLLKMAGVVGAIMAVKGALEGYTEAQDKAFAEGNFGQDIKTFWDDFKQQPFEAIGKEFRASLTPPPTLQTDLATAGTAISTFFSTTVPTAFAKVKASFETDFIGFFAGLPARIGTAISGLGASLYLSATTAWEQFRLATEAKFVELGGTVGSLPYRIGVAIGSLIGMAAQWAIDTWNAWKTQAGIKIDEIVADVQALPGKIGAAIGGLADTLRQKASDAWEQFKANARQKGDQAVADARAIPGKVGSAIAALPGILRQKATEAWQSFKASAIAKANEIIADARALPGKIKAGIGNVGTLLLSTGRSIIDGLLSGIKAGVQAMYDFVSGIAAGIRARKGPLSYDKKLLIPAGNAIIKGLVQGMDQAMPGLWNMIRGINSDLTGIGGTASQFNLQGSAAVAGTTAGATQPVLAGVTPKGSDGTAAPVETFTIGKVEIPAKDIAEMKSVTDFFGAVKQKARAGKASG